MDEVGCNIDMSGDGRYKGQKYLGIRDHERPTKKHWTTLGLTPFNGDPVMCIVILSKTICLRQDNSTLCYSYTIVKV